MVQLSTGAIIPWYCLLLICGIPNGLAYTNDMEVLFSDFYREEQIDFGCGGDRHRAHRDKLKHRLSYAKKSSYATLADDWTFSTITTTIRVDTDPFEKCQKILQQILFGSQTQDQDEEKVIEVIETIPLKYQNIDTEASLDPLAQFPSGDILRAELFQNKTSVHIPTSEFLHQGHLYLNPTKDYMQTALNAFAIFLKGDLDDVLRLPANYVLKSAKSIAMMKIAKEKLVATWTVVKEGKRPIEIPFRVLEMYRPLFKYLNGKEMARLNLSDERILNYIGTHVDLDRHQVGVVASEYIKMNKNWMEPKYLNLMNNLLCGVPMNFMRKASENTYLQLNHQIFYHIHACDPLQRRFYYAMMTRTQALGKPYSWSARDVSRLGLLLSEVHGPDLATVNPEAMSGITAQVMLEIPPENLQHITEMQLRFIHQKPLNILAKRLRDYQEEQRLYGMGSCLINFKSFYMFMIALAVVMK